MPRFFFDIDDSHSHVWDDVGTDLPDVEAAKNEAVAILPEIAREKLPDRDHGIFTSIVRDESDRIVCRAVLSLTAAFVGEQARPLPGAAVLRRSFQRRGPLEVVESTPSGFEP